MEGDAGESYCLCGTADDGRMMLECAANTRGCGGWVHPDCFQMKAAEIADAQEEDEWVCPLCANELVDEDAARAKAVQITRAYAAKLAAPHGEAKSRAKPKTPKKAAAPAVRAPSPLQFRHSCRVTTIHAAILSLFCVFAAVRPVLAPRHVCSHPCFRISRAQEPVDSATRRSQLGLRAAGAKKRCVAAEKRMPSQTRRGCPAAFLLASCVLITVWLGRATSSYNEQEDTLSDDLDELLGEESEEEEEDDDDDDGRKKGRRKGRKKKKQKVVVIQNEQPLIEKILGRRWIEVKALPVPVLPASHGGRAHAAASGLPPHALRALAHWFPCDFACACAVRGLWHRVCGGPHVLAVAGWQAC